LSQSVGVDIYAPLLLYCPLTTVAKGVTETDSPIESMSRNPGFQKIARFSVIGVDFAPSAPYFEVMPNMWRSYVSFFFYFPLRG
jgi:hypothetical protein